jgi:hypothetical protein
VAFVFILLHGKKSGEPVFGCLETSLNDVSDVRVFRGSLDGVRGKSLDGVLSGSLEAVSDLRFLRYFLFVSLSTRRSVSGGEACRFPKPISMFLSSPCLLLVNSA